MVPPYSFFYLSYSIVFTIFAANFLDKPKTKAINNGLIGLVI